MISQRLQPKGPFNLATSAQFLCGFKPAAGTSVLDDDGALTLGFLSDGDFRPVTVRVRARDGAVDLEAPSETVLAQVRRILSLDDDATALAAVAERDTTVARLLERRPGFRPIAFSSPYEAAVWGVLAQRSSMVAASSVKRKLSEATGAMIEGFGRRFYPSPTPEAWLEMTSAPGVSQEKLVRLQGIARAALAGRLDADTLKAMPEERAIEQLQSLRGVGAWTARHVLYRGCGVSDALPSIEPRVLRGVGEAYGLGRTATIAELATLSEGWRPYRMWISILLVWSISGTARWHGPEKRG